MKYLRFVLAVVAVLVGVIATSTATNATYQSNDSRCLDPNKKSSYETSLTRGTGTIATRDGHPLCESVNLVFESFNMPDTWDGKGWNETAIPQTKFAVTPFTIPAGVENYKETFTVATPDKCKPTQLDFYFIPEYESITTMDGDEERFIDGEIFPGKGECEQPKKVQVCDLTTLDVITIDEKDFDESKHSKNLADCDEKPNMIKVCELSTKSIVTIDEKDFESSKYSHELSDCDTPEIPETPEAPETPETPEELPRTGLGGVFGSLLGLGSLVASSAYYINSRRIS